MAKTKKQEWDTEIRVKGVSEKTKTDIVNIAKNSGVTISQLLKPKIREIADSYPDKMRQPPLDY